MIDSNLILESLRKVCLSEIPKYQRPEFYNSVPRALFNSFAELGVTGLNIPEQFGGIGISMATSVLVMETIAQHDLGPAIFLSVHAMVSGLIYKHGNSTQHAKYLEKLANGETLGAFALTEPSAGSDAAALTTIAILDGDSYILNGEKCYITSAGYADVYIVFARTAGGKEPSISAFIVPAATPGLTIGKAEQKMGCELSPIASIHFNNARISRDNLLGAPHEGLRVALSGLAGGRVNIAACANGLSIAALNAARNHLNARKQFGQMLYDFQGLQFMLADMYCRLEGARLVTVKASADLDQEKSTTNNNSKLSSAVAKCMATDAAMQITTDAVQLLGGAGYIKDYGVERLMRDAKMLQIVEGSNQVQRMIIARELRTKDFTA